MKLATLSARRRPQATPPQDVLVVGNGMVGHRLCRKLRESPTGRHHRITVLGEEPLPAYDRMRLSDSLELTPEELLLSPEAWYLEEGIDLRVGERAVAIDREARLVRTDRGTELAYDTLVLATGAAPVLPPIEGVDHPAVHVFRTLDDVAALRRRSEDARSAAVIGGGLLGLEAARALGDAGLEVHVIEASAHLMPRQLDGTSAAVLWTRVTELGVHVHLSALTRRIAEGSDGRLSLDVDAAGDTMRLSADLVVVAAGIRPRDELAREAGLQVGARGGVIVDDELRTSDPHIRAIGECALHRGVHYGLVAPGYAMADAVSDALSGRPASFTGGDTSCHLKLLGVPVSAVGMYDQEMKLVGADVDGGRRSLLLDGRRLMGATAVGDWPDMPRVRDAIERGRSISEAQLRRFKREGELWGGAARVGVEGWPAATVVCGCTGVTRGQLGDALRTQGRDVEALARCTGASTVCGSCKPLLAQLTGATTPATPVAGRRAVTLGSVLALALAALLSLGPPIPFATSVQSSLAELDELWRDGALKQLTGYTLVALALLGGVLSLRKRVRWFSFGRFGHYRALHSLLGAACLLALLGHTGMRFGHNLNQALMVVFVGVSVLGAMAGVATSLEARPGGQLGSVARRWRPRLSSLHLLLFWPLPLLLGLHVFTVYYF